ncbi:hypothetical protein AX16_004914 [Volvariella volvacea WC 439]|nr:hypothetical protein AX16_004914 [Volvariella volvacea WC 439]
MSAQSPNKRGFAEVTWLEVVKVAGVGLSLPAVLTYRLLSSPFVKHNSSKSWRRVLNDSSVQFVTGNCNPHQLQFLFKKPSIDCYKDWTKKKQMPFVVDEVGEDSRLLWVGPKRIDKVLIFCHGGAFMLPLQDYHLDFLKYIQEELKAKGLDVGVAALNYTLVPTGMFPTQLRELRAAVSYLTDAGTQPGSIQLMGDSSGGNLIAQLLSHILHPLDGVPPLILSGRLGGAYLMSPSVCMTVDSRIVFGKHPAEKTDTIGFRIIHEWSQVNLREIPRSQLHYIDSSRTPDGWFQGVNQVVDRILVSAGDLECLKESIVAFATSLKSYHGNVELVVQMNGVHEDPLNDFAAAGGKSPKTVGELTPLIVSWLVSGFNQIVTLS